MHFKGGRILMFKFQQICQHVEVVLTSFVFRALVSVPPHTSHDSGVCAFRQNKNLAFVLLRRSPPSIGRNVTIMIATINTDC